MKTPRENLDALRGNRYPGRGLCVGLDESGKHLLQVYWIMGRSANSRNRVFVADGTSLRTEPADASKLQDPSLTIYNAMLEEDGAYIVTNGDQTDTIFEALADGSTFVAALETREYEPDPPIFTPRISSLSLIDGEHVTTYLSVLKKSPHCDACIRETFQHDGLPKGAGCTITTYMSDGDPPPSFHGEPYLLPLEGAPKKAAETIWNALDKENRVSLALKAVEIASGASKIEIINAYKKV